MLWHAVEIEALLQELAADPAPGLSREEAQARLSEHGPNVLQVEEGPSAWKILLSQFTDVLIIILLIATVLSALVGELFDAGLILSIVGFSAGLGFVQEYRAERAVEALREMLSPAAIVLRGGEEREVAAREVVPGDVLLLEAGDRVAADARVLDSHVLKADESALTGESVPVEKQPAVLPDDTRVAERHNMLFMGTAVVHGRGRAVVVATGMDTEFGQIAKDVGAAEEVRTPLERRTAEIGKWLGALSLGVVLLVVAVGISRQLWVGQGLRLEFAISLAMFSVSLAVAIHPVMITGDHKLTAVAVAKEVGIFQEGDEALTGAELEAISDEEFAQRVAAVSVYARVSPADKIKIVRAWKQSGDIVAMTGDGVNDAPALKHADVGVAMGITGTEVAKEAADMVLADDNFATILKAVGMGRWIYDNIKKYLTYLVSANLVEVVVIAGIVLYKGAEYLPLLPAAILYINLITDGLPAIALGFAPPEPDVMQRPPRDPQESVFSREVKAFMLIALAFTPVFFWVFLRGQTLMEGRTDLFFLFLLFELMFVFSLRSLRYSLVQVPPHGWLLAAVAGSLAVTAGVMALPRVREAFGIAIPSLEEIEIVLAVSVAVTVLSELVKVAFRRRREGVVKKTIEGTATIGPL